MKTNIINIHGMWVVKTGRVFVYQDEYDDYSYSEEIVDICTGEHYGFDRIIHLIGDPYDVFNQNAKRIKRGHHSNSANKQGARNRQLARIEDDDLPF